jgi:hypothetical protein
VPEPGGRQAGLFGGGERAEHEVVNGQAVDGMPLQPGHQIGGVQ